MTLDPGSCPAQRGIGQKARFLPNASATYGGGAHPCAWARIQAAFVSQGCTAETFPAAAVRAFCVASGPKATPSM